MLIKLFLQRTGITALPERNLAGLSMVMRTMSETIPFENLDVQLGRIVSLEIDSIADKILRKNRGGYCYEINGLLYHILKTWGIHINYLGARTIMGYTERRPVTHMLLKVTLPEGHYLCDLGFTGLCPAEPIPLNPQTPPSENYRLIDGEANSRIFQSRSPHGEWKSLYSFEDRPLETVDFELANYFNNRSEQSICTRQLLCFIRRKNQSFRLVQNHLTITEGTTLHEEILKTHDEFRQLLAQTFGLSLKLWETETLFKRVLDNPVSMSNVIRR